MMPRIYSTIYRDSAGHPRSSIGHHTVRAAIASHPADVPIVRVIWWENIASANYRSGVEIEGDPR